MLLDAIVLSMQAGSDQRLVSVSVSNGCSVQELQGVSIASRRTFRRVLCACVAVGRPATEVTDHPMTF